MQCPKCVFLSFLNLHASASPFQKQNAMADREKESSKDSDRRMENTYHFNNKLNKFLNPPKAKSLFLHNHFDVSISWNFTEMTSNSPAIPDHMH